MNHSTRHLCALAIAGLIACSGASAETDVEQADSLRFQEFFKDKKDAVKVWKDAEGNLETGKRTETIKAYDTPATAPAPAASPSPAPASTAVTTDTDRRGQRFELRERYTLGRSASTPYSAFYVIEALHKQSAQLCARGWKKLGERSEPVEQDFYMYYEIECL